MSHYRLFVIGLLLVQSHPLCAQIPGFTLPPGFIVTEFAGDHLAHDIYTMTIDARGRIFVAGRGYIRQLIDDDGDGKADRALDVADHPKDGAMGLLVEGDTLFAVGDGALRRFQLGSDGRAVGKSVELVRVKTGQEHTAHAIRRGPDGWLYLLCGDATADFGKKALPHLAPMKLPVGGFMLRFSPDFKTTELVADGFRNPYDLDFTADGEPVTFDSDNERCVGLPWYEGCRLYHILPGGHYGWQAPQHATTWRMPPYFIDVVAPILNLGRGSPTGVAAYRHRQFPEKYRGGVFVADWTFGRIWFVALKPNGGTYEGKAEQFLQSSGDLGLAPTALAVHPLNGDLYVSIGGRGTRGAVYRISYPAGERTAAVIPSAPDDAYVFRKRRQIEAFARGRSRTSKPVRAEFLANIIDPDRTIRQAALRLEFAARDLQMARVPIAGIDATVLYWSLTQGLPAARELQQFFSGSVVTADAHIDVVRGLQRYLGDIGASEAKGTVFEGYTPRDALVLQSRQSSVLRVVQRAFPTGVASVDRELSRLLAQIGDASPATLMTLANYLNRDLSPLDEVHFLIVIARLRGSRTPFVTRQTASALLDLDQRYIAANIPRDTNWPLRIAELHAELSRKDPNLNRTVVEAPDFARPGNAILTRAPGFDRRRAALKFLDRAEHDASFAWNADIIALLDAAPSDVRQPWLDRLWDRGGFEQALLPILACEPREADRSKFNDGLRSPQRAIAEVCLRALEQLPPPSAAEELLPVVRALRSIGDSRADAKLRQRLVELLRCATHQRIGTDRAAWTAWFIDTFPEQAAKLSGSDGVDRAAWNRRLTAIDWSQGEAGRGKGAFEKASCAACHSAASAIGPDLHGVAHRFSRDDLFTAILEPSKDIAPQYRSVQIVTTTGKVYQGLIVYDSPDGIMLQTGATTTVRIAGDAVESRATIDVSLMPTELLDKLANNEIADLLAYLRSLANPGR
jgi:putative heme-binding domain-containing protein